MPDFAPLQFLLALFAGIVNRHQQRVIDYLALENKILKAALGDKRVRFTDDQRRRFAILGKALGRDPLDRFANIVSPGTILLWHRRLFAIVTSPESRTSARSL
jgi:hypothetical protein